MKLTYEAKLYPSKQQEQKLLEMFFGARKLYNEMLETKISAYKNEKKNVSRFDLQKQFKAKHKGLPASVKQMMAYKKIAQSQAKDIWKISTRKIMGAKRIQDITE